jgi:hypothetical protein
MITQAFESVTRQAAAAVSRRTSLLTLGGAALAASIATPDVSEAKKGKDCKKKEKQRCSKDAAACKTTVIDVCEDEAACLAALTPCCDECSANGFFTCFIAANQP